MDKYDELAEKVAIELRDKNSCQHFISWRCWHCTSDMIAVTIRKAVMQERIKMHEGLVYDEGVAWGKASALEEAAKIAETRFQNINRTHALDAGMEIAESICARAKEMK